MSQIKSMTPKGELSKDSKGRMKTAIRKVINLTRTRAQKGDSALSQPMLELLHKSHNLAFLRNTLPIQNVALG